MYYCALFFVSLSILLSHTFTQAEPIPKNEGFTVLCRQQEQNYDRDFETCMKEMAANPETHTVKETCSDECFRKSQEAHEKNVKIYEKMKGAELATAGDSSQDKSYIESQNVAREQAKVTAKENGEIKDLRQKIIENENKTLKDVNTLSEKLPASTISQAQSKAATKKVIKQAAAAVENDRKFPKTNVNEIENIDIRKKLSTISEAQEVKPLLQNEETKLSDQLVELLKMAEIAGQASQQLGAADKGSSITPSSSGISAVQVRSEIKSSADPENGRSLSKIVEGKNGENSALSSTSVLDPEDIPQPTDSPAVKAEKAARSSKKSSLRERLSAFLKAGGVRGGPDDPLAHAQFSGTAGKEDIFGHAEATRDHRDQNSAFDLAASALQDRVPKSFSMNGIETDAAIRDLTAEAEALEQGGVLGSESTSLFERVSATYRTLQKFYLLVH